MPHEWIKADLALKYVSDEFFDTAARRRICERAHGGLIAAKAERIIWQGREESEHLIGKGFWWAEGGEALEQDWQSGDFSTWIDQKIEVKAFGVSFDFGALSELVPSDMKADALRRVSVAGHEDWISAAQVHSAVIARGNPMHATAVLAEASRLGQFGARAMRASFEARIDGSVRAWSAIEWDVPLWFWKDFADVRKGVFEWHLGKVRGEGRLNGVFTRIQLQGVYFHKSGLTSLGMAAGSVPFVTEPESKRGRRPKYDWPATSLAIFGHIYRGDLKPESQADIERALISHLTQGDVVPSESTVRPYAKQIWEEFSKA